NGRIQTSSPPCPGVTAAGTYAMHRSAQSVGLNWGVMRSNGYGSLVARANVSLAEFITMPFMAFAPDISKAVPVCYPVLTGHVTVAPNSVALSIDGTLLTPADREIVIRNTSRIPNPTLPVAVPSENHFPRNVIEPSFVMAGRDRDAFQVKAIYFGGE